MHSFNYQAISPTPKQISDTTQTKTGQTAYCSLCAISGLKGPLIPLQTEPSSPEKTIADATLDRLVYSAHRMELRGEFFRKREKQTNETKKDQFNTEEIP